MKTAYARIRNGFAVIGVLATLAFAGLVAWAWRHGRADLRKFSDHPRDRP